MSQSTAVSTKRAFTLAAILNIRTGRLLTGMDDIYDLLNFMTGDSLFTHVLPRAMKFADPIIREQLPLLATAKFHEADMRLDGLLDGCTDTAAALGVIKGWLDEQTLAFGGSHELTSAKDSWLSLDPIAEAEAIFGQEKVVAIAH